MKYRNLFIFFIGSYLIAGDVTDIKKLLIKHYSLMNAASWSEVVANFHSKGTINGDSNGSFWYSRASTEKAFTKNMSAGEKYNFTPRYINVDVLETAPKYPKIAMAYHYLVGSYTIDGVTKNDYRTRVSHVLVTENGQWKIKLSDFTPLHSGSGIPD